MNENAPDQPNGRMSLAEIGDQLSRIGRGPDTPDKLKALRMLMTMHGAESTADGLLSEEQIADRLVRIMRCTGIGMVQLCYKRAFRKSTRMRNAKAPKLEAESLGIDVRRLPRTLKQLYRAYPEIKRGGFPPGFPVGRGPEAQQEWCRKTAMRIEKERRTRAAQEAAAELRDTDEDIRAEGTAAEDSVGQ